MTPADFTIAFSEKNETEAVREVSLKIKSIFPKHIEYLIILYTSNYNPANILKGINFTLKPEKILGIPSPFLVFEGKVISKGIVACCLNKPLIKSHEAFLKKGESQQIEPLLSASFKKIKKKDSYFLSFLSPPINPYSYLKDMKSALGKILNFIGAGYLNKYSAFSYQILNGSLAEGMVSLALEGLKIDFFKLGAYLPLGKPFTITKAIAQRGIIREINNRPAVDIYKYYLQEKFESFIKNHLFSFYPFGIKSNGSTRLVNITDVLEDGSLLCIGDVTSHLEGNIMFLDSNFLFENWENKLKPIKDKGSGLVFVINSLIRKKILRDSSDKEIQLLKQTLGNESKVIGFYSDYCLSPDQEGGQINTEAGNLLVTLWQ